MKPRIILSALITVSLVLFYFTFFKENMIEESDPYGDYKIIPVYVRNSLIFIKYAYGGITEDKEIIVISKDSSQTIDKNNDIIYEGYRNSYLYYVKQDTLNILLLGMKQNRENQALKNIVKVNNSESARKYYDLYDNGHMVDDSIRLREF